MTSSRSERRAETTQIGIATQAPPDSAKVSARAHRKLRRHDTSTSARRYHPLIELGRGGCAVVHAAVSVGVGGFRKLVVLKSRLDALHGDDAAIEEFMKEARVAARMNHPNVVQTFEVYQDAETPVLVMEYLNGISLAKAFRYLFEDSRFSARVATYLVCEVLQGLDYAHCLRDYDGRHISIVHRDVSPQNVMLTYDGQVKLVDFGIARLIGDGEEPTKNALKGKIAYMPPEQLNGDVIDGRVDVFAAGVILWEALAKRRMWGDLSSAAIMKRLADGNIPQLLDHAPDVDPCLAAICQRAVSPSPDRRYPSAGEMADELRDLWTFGGQMMGAVELGQLLSSCCAPVRRRAEQRLTRALEEFDARHGAESRSSSSELLAAVDERLATATRETPGNEPSPSLRARLRRNMRLSFAVLIAGLLALVASVARTVHAPLGGGASASTGKAAAVESRPELPARPRGNPGSQPIDDPAR